MFVAWGGRQLRKGIDDEHGTATRATSALTSMERFYDEKVVELSTAQASYDDESRHRETFFHAQRLARDFIKFYAEKEQTPGRFCNYVPGSEEESTRLAREILALARR